MANYIKLSGVCDLLGISNSTIYRWLKRGLIKEAFKTAGGHRRFDEERLVEQFKCKAESEEKDSLLYARVSSHDQKKDMETQMNKLKEYAVEQAINNTIDVCDLGSGLNYKKKGLNRVIDLIVNKRVGRLIINHKDRLLRFGSELIFKLCKMNGVEVIILNKTSDGFEGELVNDVIELMTVYCAKLYGKRSHKNKLKKVLTQAA